ncbi:unnamed protein product, partial [Closterium sp. NIES-53]
LSAQVLLEVLRLGTGGGRGGSSGGGGGSGGSGGSGGGGSEGGGIGDRRAGSGGGQRQQQQRRSETKLPLIAIFDLYFDAILSAMYALSVSAEGDCRETSPTLRWTGKFGDASVSRVWGSRAFVRDTSADKLSPRAIPCVFLGFVPNAPCWQFYHPTSRRVFPSQDVTFDESVPFYHLFPYRTAPPPPPPLFLAPGPPPVDPIPPQGPAPSGVSLGAETGGAELGGVQPRGGERGGTKPKGVEPGGTASEGAASEGAESGGAEPQGAASSGVTAAGGAGVGVPGDTVVTGPGGARTRGTGAAGNGGVEGAGARDPTESGATGASGSGAGGTAAGGAGVGGTSAGGAGVGGFGVGGAGAGGAGAVDPGGAVRPRPNFVPLLQPLQPASPLPAPPRYTEQSGGLTESLEPASCPVSPVCTAHCVPCTRPPPVPGTHTTTLRPSSVHLHVPLPAPPESPLPDVPEPESGRACAASPTVSRLLAIAVTDPSFESATGFALFA